MENPEDMYVEPTCANANEFVYKGWMVDYDDQVFVMYEFREQTFVMQGWLCKDELCSNAKKGRHLVPELINGATLLLDSQVIKNVKIYTTEEMKNILEGK